MSARSVTVSRTGTRSTGAAAAGTIMNSNQATREPVHIGDFEGRERPAVAVTGDLDRIADTQRGAVGKVEIDADLAAGHERDSGDRTAGDGDPHGPRRRFVEGQAQDHRDGLPRQAGHVRQPHRYGAFRRLQCPSHDDEAEAFEGRVDARVKHGGAQAREQERDEPPPRTGTEGPPRDLRVATRFRFDHEEGGHGERCDGEC